MLDLKMAILDRFKKDDLETALIRKSNRELGLVDRTHHGEKYNSKNIKWLVEEKRFRELFKSSYNDVMDNICRHIRGESDDNKLLLIKSLRKITSLDLAYSYLGQFVYREKRVAPDLCFPLCFNTENGDEVSLKYARAPVDMRGKIVVETPYCTDKWLGHLKRNDDLDAERFEAGVPRYYPEINLLVQGPGSIHRTAEGFLNKRAGTVMAHVYEENDLYTHLTTDGYSWLNRHTGEKIKGCQIDDYRFAIIFTLRQMERDIERDQ